MPTAVASLLLITVTYIAASGLMVSGGAPSTGPAYRADSRLVLPERYREWVFLSSGFDMSYARASGMGDAHMFDNVFVEPHAYAAFRRSGHWPDGTMLVLESRTAQGRGSINRAGHFQTDVTGIEVHVLDRARFAGGWAFFAFDPASSAGTLLPPAAACYQCHSAHGAVDTTFVQFYPTLMPFARRYRSFRAAEDIGSTR